MIRVWLNKDDNFIKESFNKDKDKLQDFAENCTKQDIDRKVNRQANIVTYPIEKITPQRVKSRKPTISRTIYSTSMIT